ncbi:uncharacterized protein MICPUCDRAFT_50491 [Micromonas pusilla CCMP1545]|uniref:Predicted protein n=1 Tax=Micromonas pusilla (strain CCMP1545) TaxID=564608 RepID=C1MI98_MICPC|nr:uncharacterized protein MICPUCDRAFT_50491 [Micromonas pusilla CCMP1545]EEH60343.1 predicted protein [Micromonas pusilla CCMP1545]|eukprot:XP_003055091.1 predicted protein [Micromonas pusilla CCMP1545]
MQEGDVGVAAVPVNGRRLPRGESDVLPAPSVLGRGCETCDASLGRIVLFFAYRRLRDPSGVVDRLRATCEAHGVTGKIRVGAEGINGTAAGSIAGIDALRRACENDEDEGLRDAARSIDWKPTPGCAHLFDALSVRLVPEIVPFEGAPLQLGARDRSGRRRRVEEREEAADDAAAATPPPPPPTRGCPIAFVDPLDFHRAVLASSATTSAAAAAADAEADDADVVVLDVRNWYESRVGHFDGARLLPLRRFGQLPEYFDSRCPPDLVAGKEVYMYCTGGIRCEKAAEYLAGLAPGPDGAPRAPRAVKKLRGGIVAYQRDVADGEGRERSAFKGCNFVFDKRGAVRVTDDVVPSAWCDGCGVESDALGKCRGSGCHAILVACASCAAAGVYCCAACRAQDDDAAAAVAAATDGCGNKKRQRRKPCDCDGYAARERRLLPRAPTTEDAT